jgi:hypothetical protein
VTRREQAAELRVLLAEYRGCRFTTGGSGGAQGMIFLHRDGKEYFIGGLHRDDAAAVTRALNLVLELIYTE